MDSLETQIRQWRTYVGSGGAVDGPDVDELESHLRDQIADLGEAGLSDDEAFLVAVKRMGEIDVLSREFAREHSDRLWKQLVLSGGPESPRPSTGLSEALVLAVAAAVVLQIARLLARWPTEEASWLIRNASLFVLPFLAWYFAGRRGLPARRVRLTAVPFVVAALVVNLYPWSADSSTELLAALHLPIALWFVVAYPYMGGTWRSHRRRMDFIRFTGEWFVYYALIAMGGAVLVVLTSLILEPVSADLSEQVVEWVLPSGAAGAVLVAAWLVEAKQSVVENMAPVLAAVFTPLFAVVLAGAAIAYGVSGLGDMFDRDMLVVFDAMLVVVAGLVLYAISSRGSSQPAGWLDRIQLVAIAGAIVLDMIVLGSMLARIGDLGLTPNRVAALGLNVVLLVNLGWAAVLSTRFLFSHVVFHRIERWQTTYLPVYGFWAGAVVTILPPFFAFG